MDRYRAGRASARENGPGGARWYTADTMNLRPGSLEARVGRSARWSARLLIPGVLAACACAPAGPAPAPAPDYLWGVTIDDVSDLDAIQLSLRKLSRRPTARIVFDELVPAGDYLEAAVTIHAVSGVMGELVDSMYVPLYTPAQYEQRAAEYLDALGPDVDIWEIGNEINGEWVCAPDAEACTPEQTAEVVQKITLAFDQVKQRGRPAALTLYYNEGCYSHPDNEVFTWAAANVPRALKEGLDYVFLSYYEDDCNGLQPDWPAVFQKLAAMFPDAKLGIGECGTAEPSRKEAYLDRYYRMSIPEPRFVGGFFWWYFREDMVPHTAPLWSALDDAIAGR